MTLPADIDAALYAELVPHRISRPPSLHTGPTEQYRRLELARLAWRLAHPGMKLVDGIAVAAS